MSPFLIHIYSVGNIETTKWVKSYARAIKYLESGFEYVSDYEGARPVIDLVPEWRFQQ
jgi:hypothetical protein